MRDALFAPGDVRGRYLHNEFLQIYWDGRPASGSRFPSPEQTKALPMPADEGVGLYDDEHVSPVEQPTQGHHREPRRVVGTARCLLALDEERELFPEEEIFRGEGAPGTEEVTTKSDGIEYDM